MNYLGFPSNGSGSTDLLNVDSDILPSVTDTYDIGRPAKRFRNGEFVEVISDSFVKNGGTNLQYLMADGSVTTSSGGGQGSNIYLYLNSTLVSGTPAPSYLRFNNAVQASATQVAISYQARYGIDIDAFLALIDQNSILYIQDYASATNYIKFAVTLAANTPNVATICNVTFMAAEGTGLTSFGNNTPIFLSIFVDTASIDNRLTTLELDQALLDTKTQNQSAVAGTTTFTSKILTTDLDTETATTLTVGNTTASVVRIGKLGSDVHFPGNVQSESFDARTAVPMNIGATLATQINIGRVASLTAISGTSCNILTRLNTPLLDVVSATQLNIGTLLATSINIGNGSITTAINGSSCNIGTRLNTPLLDRSTAGQLSIGINATTTGILIGNGTIVTAISGASTDVNTRLNVPQLDRVSAGTLSIGTSTNSTAISIGQGTIVTTITGASTAVTTRLNCPLHDTATAVGLNIGTLTQNALIVGRVGANTTINALALVLNTTPFIVANSATGSRPVISRWTMTPTLATQVAAQNLTTSGFGSVAFTVADAYNTFVVGSALRYKFNGYLQSMSLGSTIGISLTHAGGTQSLFSITFASATTVGFIKGEINMNFTTVGAAISPAVNGFVDYVDGTTMKNVCIQLNAFSPLFNTTVSNAMTCATVVSGTTVQYVINNFTVEQLR